MQWFDDCDFFPKDYERNFQDFFDFEVSEMQTWFSRVWHDRDLSGSFLLPPRDPGRSAGCCAGPGDRPAGQGLHRLGHPDSQNTQPSSILQHSRQAAEIFHLWSVEQKLMRNNRLFQGLTPASPTSLYSNQVKWSLKQFSLNFFSIIQGWRWLSRSTLLLTSMNFMNFSNQEKRFGVKVFTVDYLQNSIPVTSTVISTEVCKDKDSTWKSPFHSRCTWTEASREAPRRADPAISSVTRVRPEVLLTELRPGSMLSNSLRTQWVTWSQVAQTRHSGK